MQRSEAMNSKAQAISSDARRKPSSEAQFTSVNEQRSAGFNAARHGLWTLLPAQLNSYIISFLITLASQLASCGPDTNIFTVLTPKAESDSFSYRVAKARALYDKGKTDEALTIAEKAYETYPNDMDLNILLGYIYLAKAGMDTISLAKNLSNQGKSSGSTTGGSGDGSKKDTSDVLTSLSGVLGLTSDDFLRLGELDTSDTELPLLVPMCAEQARTILAQLDFANRAVKVTCNIVDDDVKIDGEPRHACQKVAGSHVVRGKAHFLWAFAHLAEAIVFNSVVLYSTGSDGSKTNLEKRVEKLKTEQPQTVDEIISFSDRVSALAETVNAILPVGTQCSELYPSTQLKAMLNDMKTVDRTFSMFPNTPKNVTKSITGAMEKISSMENNVNSNLPKSEVESEQTKALKAQMTKNLSAVVGAKINELAAQGNVPAEELANLCASYDSISGGQAPADQVPQQCQPPAEVPEEIPEI